MEFDSTYKVHFTGTFLDGVEPHTAISNFATLAKIPVEQAQTVLSQPRVLKKQLDINVAHTYRDKLQSIGLDVTLQPEQAEAEGLELSLEPIQDRHQQPEENNPLSHLPKSASGEITCPKCGHQQTATQQCESCGVYMHKVKPRIEEQTSTVEPTQAEPQIEPKPEEDWTPQDPKPVAVLAVIAVAAVCAYLWKLIAIVTEYEIGIVAWAVGGAIGIVAVALGSIGIRTAIICSVMVLCSIIGGKYLIQDHYLGDGSEMQALLASEELSQFYQDYAEIALHYVNHVHTDEEIRDFMVEYEYTEAISPTEISEAELNEFKEYDAAELHAMVEAASPGSETNDLSSEDIMNSLADYSPWDGVKDSLAPIDFLFFFLGIATAFKMALTGRIR